MATSPGESLSAYCERIASEAARSSQLLRSVTGSQKNGWLIASAHALRSATEAIISANEQDVQRAPDFGLTPGQIDRLQLNRSRIEDIASSLEQLAAWPDPIGEVIDGTVRPSGLRLQRIRVPLGVVFFIYESRPNVTADAAGICIKSGNAVILRGGKEAFFSSDCIVKLLQKTAESHDIPPQAIQLVETADRDAVGHLLALNQWIDVAIPRGGESLIRRVAHEATMPVIKHFTGNCHVYVDAAADLGMAERITVNSKCQRLGVCNAAESLLVHAKVADSFLPNIYRALSAQGIEIRGDEATRTRIPNCQTASESDYFTEYLGPIISVKIVESVQDAIDHINHYGSHHTDTIVTDSVEAAELFLAEVDSAAVMLNASTRFHDGGEFGLGAEIGISTDKFHARGPCGLRELTSYKYIVRGTGQTR
ncbi:MAG: glutamate-5-semialdehyde dehydrogenase [Planctomycetota bacterium]|nr:glutamate-5-semialdehyde dehydrogenase [Planctomycetota bacterium]MDA1178962.1 glutamate-5-semialdehyde dehydrogenase [Planctomycetota bacterium]